MGFAGDGSCIGKQPNSAPRLTGVVRWWSDNLGYGFLEPLTETNGRDIHIHWQQVLAYNDGVGRKPHITLEEGQRVEFELRMEERGPKAYEVVVLD